MIDHQQPAGGFGRLRREFAATTGVRLVWALFLLITAAAFGVWAVIGLHDDASWWQIAIPGAIAIGALAGMVERLVTAIRYRGEAVLLYENGFVHRTPRGEDPYAWTEIDAVWQKVTRVRNTFANNLSNVDCEVTVAAADGRRIILEEFHDIRELGTAIEGAVARRRLPAVLSGINDGETVTIGAFTVNRDGLGWSGGDFRPWSQVSARVNNGCLEVDGLGWAPIAAIPNYPVLTTVLNTMAQWHRGQ